MLNPYTPAITDAQQAAPNMLNYRVPTGVTIPGAYSNSIYTEGALGAGITGFNQVMMQQAEHFDPFIQRSLIDQPRFWYDRIPRGAYPNFSGVEQETRIFRGGLVKYAGTGEWRQIDPMPSATNNPCGTGSYVTPKYAWERLQWTGFKTYWGSDPICSENLRFVDQAIQQLAWILETGADYGISIQEVWNRDSLIRYSVDYDRSFIMTSSYVGNSSAPRYYYEPRCTFNVGSGTYDITTSAATAGVTGPFIVFPAGTDVEPLNFDVLDALHESLDVRCRGSALSTESGRPIYGLPISTLDFERYIKGNQYEVANWRESRSEKLIQGYDLGVKTHRGFAIMDDGNQLRFKIKGYIASYNSANFANLFSALDGQPVFVAQYVAPRIEGRLGENNQPIPEDNPEYFTAELAVMPILMNKVFTNLMGTPVTSLGSATFFGPQMGLNGKWSWVNNPGQNNEEGNIGNFRGKFEIFPRPEISVVHATSFLYRRCTESIRSRCPVDNVLVDPDTATGAVAAVSYSAAAADVVQATSVSISATLGSKLTDVGVGDAVTLKFTGAGTLAAVDGVTGYVIRSASAPTYTIHIPSLVAQTVTLAADSAIGVYVVGGVLANKAAADAIDTVPLVLVSIAKA